MVEPPYPLDLYELSKVLGHIPTEAEVRERLGWVFVGYDWDTGQALYAPPEKAVTLRTAPFVFSETIQEENHE